MYFFFSEMKVEARSDFPGDASITVGGYCGQFARLNPNDARRLIFALQEAIKEVERLGDAARQGEPA